MTITPGQPTHRPPLEPRAVLSLLLEKGLLDRSRVTTNAVRLRSSPHRNHNFFIQSESGSSYFLKQGITATTAASIRHEAAFYQSVSASLMGLKQYTPEFVCFLPDVCVLVLDLVGNGRSLHQIPKRLLRPQLFSSVGAAMAVLHSYSEFADIRAGQRPSPMVARVSSLSPEDLRHISAAGLELMRTIQSYPDYEDLLIRALDRSGDQCLTHNDFKSSNCLVPRDRNDVVFVDWEFAAIGDPAWDVGCVFADVLSRWLFSMPLGSRIAFQRFPMIAAQPLSILQPLFRSFWTSYSMGRHLTETSAIALLLRAAKCAGLKLSQSAYEMCHHATTLSAVEFFFLQLSWNILDRPTEAIVRLFGIPLSDRWWDECEQENAAEGAMA